MKNFLVLLFILATVETGFPWGSPQPKPTPVPPPPKPPVVVVDPPQPILPYKLGVNGEGFFKNLTSYDVQFLKDLGNTIVIRIPGGGDSKFAHPSQAAKGWGTRLSDINTYFDKYIANLKPLEACSSDWSGKDPLAEKNSQVSNYNVQESCNPANDLSGYGTCSYLEKLVKLSKDVPLEVVYNANVIFGNADEELAAIDYLVNNGVKVAAIEMANEPYYKINFNFNFDCYKQKFLPILDKIKAKYPDMLVSLASGNFSAGEEKPNASHDIWNTALQNFRVSDGRIGAAVIHYYLTESQCPEAWASRPAYALGLLTDPAYLASWNTASMNLYNCPSYATAFQGEVDAAKLKYPGAKIMSTEFNIKYAEDFGDTLIQGMYLFEQMNKIAPQLYSLHAHNGIGGELFGLSSHYKDKVDGKDILKLGTQPLTKEYNVRRTGYWALNLAGKSLAKGAIKLPATITPNVTEKFYYYVNVGEEYVPTITSIPTTHNLVVSNQYISGVALYSSAGYSAVNATYAKAKGSVAVDLNEIYSIKTSVDNKIPKYSFGIISYKLIAK